MSEAREGSQKSTEPAGGSPGLPIRSIRAEVIEGPDEGKVALARSESLTIGSAEGNDLILRDPTASRFHLELSRAEGGLRVIDNGSTNGTLSGGLRLERAVIPPGTILSLGKSRVRIGDGERITLELHEADELAGIRGRTPAMRRLMARTRRAARAATPVLLIGESGTGKELFARALHEEGERADGPFVIVDCASLAPSLIASELFGHERGAFTGADRLHIGAFERADGGTLFLDEIGELSRELQPSLLGALERGSFRRVGGRESISVSVRVVAATHRDLRAEVNSGSFRLDLYYRLAVVLLRIPPLRERPEDIPLLVEHFLREAGARGGREEEGLSPTLGPDAMSQLCQHRWPGNVRELRNVVEAMVAMGEGPELLQGPSGPGGASLEGLTEELLRLPYKEARDSILADFEGRYLGRLLARSEGNVSRAAREARMDRSYLIKLLQRHGLR